MKNSAAATILRWGLAFVFFYAGIAALLNPPSWIGYLPGFLARAAFSARLLAGFAVYEIVLAAWLFTGRKAAWSSLFAAVTLAAIVVFSAGGVDITFRDVGLAFAALALFELSRGRPGGKTAI